MSKIHLRTKHGDSYIIHKNGNIERGDGQCKPSGDWKFLGLRHVKRNEFIPFENMTIMLGKPLLFKNGNPQYTVVDNDHGTQRTWGNTRHHGIARLSFSA